MYKLINNTLSSPFLAPSYYLVSDRLPLMAISSLVSPEQLMRKILFLVNFPAVINSQHNDFLTVDIKKYSVIANPPSILANFTIG